MASVLIAKIYQNKTDMKLLHKKIEGLSHHQWRQEVLNKHASIAEQLRCWVALAITKDFDLTSEWRNFQMEEEGIRVKVRQAREKIHGAEQECLVIAFVELPINMRRKGWFKAFLSLCCEINPWHAVIIEDVNNRHLQGFCEALEFNVFNPFFATTYLVNQEQVRQLKAAEFPRPAI